MTIKLLNQFLLVLVILVIIGCKQKNEVPKNQEMPNSTTTKEENVSDVNQWQSVNSVVVRGKTISVGMLSDDLFTKTPNGKKILTDEEHIGKDVSKDPTNPNSLLVTHHYKTEDKFIDIVMARSEDPGPYKIKDILVKKGD